MWLRLPGPPWPCTARSGFALSQAINSVRLFAGMSFFVTTMSSALATTGANAREVKVVPVEDEKGLRHLAWIEDNRRKVDQATKGRVAYLHMPDTAFGGYSKP